MSSPSQNHLTERVFPAELEELADISAFIVESARRIGMDDRGLFAIQMSVDEAATNVIVHGYQERGVEGLIHIICWQEGSEFVVQLRDKSPPFNPGEVPEPDLCAPLERRKEGGLGIYLMRRLMDRVEFSREGDENVLTMARHCPPFMNSVDAAVVSPQGRIDATRSGYLEALIREPVEAGKNHLIVDLARVTYLSSGGLRALLVVAKELQERDGTLSLCCPSRGVKQVLHITGFTEIIPLYRTRDAAMQALGGGGESGA